MTAFPIRLARWLAPVSLLGLTAMAAAAPALPELDERAVNWNEISVPPPAHFKTSRLFEVDPRSYAQTSIGLDLDTIDVGKDGVVRYVMVMQSKTGLRNAYYQGIRCETFEVKTYARYDFDAQPPHWIEANSNWEDMRNTRTRHPSMLAKAGLCDGSTAPISNREARRTLERGASSWMAPGPTSVR